MNLGYRSCTKSFLMALALALSVIAPANASVVLGKTRVIFPGEQREVSLRVENQSSASSLAQVWLDDGDPQATPMTAKAPFAVRPPVFRIDAGKAQVLRIQQIGETPPQDRESLYWFNLRDVPATARSDQSGSESSLQLIVRTRVKVFYRPKGLKAAEAATAPHKLQWKLAADSRGGTLTVYNPTPFHVNLNKIDAKQERVTIGDGIVRPFSSAKFVLTHSQAAGIKQHVSFEYLNDHGGQVTLKAPLHPH